jgi:RHS repeat-associated protein
MSRGSGKPNRIRAAGFRREQGPAGTTDNTYNAADELTQATTGSATTAYTYDADGNQTGAGSNAYTYNSANELTGATAGSTAYAFKYNAEGDRASTSVGGTVTQAEAWDLNNALPQLATLSSGSGSSSTLIGNYHYNPLGGIESEDTAAGAYYDAHDYLGSVTALTDSNGVDQYADSYDPFGNQSVDQLVTAAPVQPFGYTGGLEDQSVSGLVDLGARTYEPSIDRFTSRDPNAPKTADPYIASYVYADDGPTYLADPSGRSSVSNWLGSEWDQFSSGFAEGAESPFKLVAGLYDAFAGANGGWSGFFDTYVPVRPAYRLYNIADILRQEGCPQLADLYENAGNELASQIAVLGISGLTGWEAAAASVDTGEIAGTAGAGGNWSVVGEQDGGAIGQANGDACINACGEMLDPRLTQDSTLGSTIPGRGWWYAGAGGLAAELDKLDPAAGWTFKNVDDVGASGTAAQIRELGAKGPFAATLKVLGGRAHSVIVDGVDADGNIVVRDPWNGGTTYTMTPSAFHSVFQGDVVFRR